MPKLTDPEVEDAIIALLLRLGPYYPLKTESYEAALRRLTHDERVLLVIERLSSKLRETERDRRERPVLREDAYICQGCGVGVGAEHKQDCPDWEAIRQGSFGDPALRDQRWRRAQQMFETYANGVSWRTQSPSERRYWFDRAMAREQRGSYSDKHTTTAATSDPKHKIHARDEKAHQRIDVLQRALSRLYRDSLSDGDD